MASKLIACAIALFVQAITAQVINNMYPAMMPNNLAPPEALAYGPVPYGPNMYPPNVPFEAIPAPITNCRFGLTLAELTANGGGFAVTSTSPITPNGVTVQSDNLLFEGPLAVTGTMPFLGSVGLEGPLPVVGQGAVAYGCGNGNVGITEELSAPANFPGPAAGPGTPMNGYTGAWGSYGPMY